MPRRLGRNLRHRQTQIAQSIGAILASADFRAPLLTSLVPTRGTGAPTYTRATTAYVRDYEGVMRQVLSGEARFTGARRVQNYLLSTEVFNTASWNVTGTATKTATGPTFPNADGSIFYQNYTAPSVIQTGGKILASVTMSGSGTITLGAARSGGLNTYEETTTAITLTSTPTRYNVVHTMLLPQTGAGIFLARGVGQTATAVTIANIQTEDITGRTDQTTPSEYVSVGVLSAPYHGAGVDGVKYFDTTLTGAAIPSSTLLGYLAEGRRTNLCLQSNAFTTIPWTENSGTATVTQDAVDPDGGTTAWTITDDRVGNTEGRYASLVLTAATYTYSIFVKKETGSPSNYPVFAAFETGGSAGTAVITIDTVNGVANAWTAYTGRTIASGLTARCRSFNVNFWRVEMSFTATASDWGVFVLPAGSGVATALNTTISNTATGSAVFYGVQVELGSFASSYIPTTTAAVTRNADVLTYPSAGNVSGTVGSAYAEVNISAPAGITNLILGVVAGAQALLYRKSTGVLADYDGVNEPTGSSISSSAQHKVGVTWGAGAKLCLDGGAAASGSFDGDFNFAGTLYVGRSTSGDELNGNIRNVCIWLRNLPEATLKRISK